MVSSHAGARALVATEGGRLVGELQAKGGIWIPFPAATKNPFSMALNVRRLARICHREKVGLVHARSRAPAWVALGAARSLNIPFVTTYHGSYAGRSSVKVLYNSVMSRGDLVIANSHYTGDLIRSLYPQAADRVRVIHRGTDFSIFSPGAVSPERVENLRKSWNVAPHERVVLLAARLTGWKGQKVLVEAAAKLRDAGISDVAYILAGDPQGRDSYVRDLDALIEARKLKGIVRRVGHCTDMPAAFLAAAVVTVPSTEPEAFGRSAVEAQAMGTPVVVSDLGAVPETVLAPTYGAPPGTNRVAHSARRRGCAGRRHRRCARAWRERTHSAGRASEASCGAALFAGANGRQHAGGLLGLAGWPFPTQNKLTSRTFARNVGSFAEPV